MGEQEKKQIDVTEVDLVRTTEIKSSIPVLVLRDGTLAVRESDRYNSELYRLKLEYGNDVCFLPDREFEDLREEVLKRSIVSFDVEEDNWEGELLDDTEVARQLENILYTAARNRASDIHIIPTEGETVIEFRVDGVLRPYTSLPRKYAQSLVNKIKMLARMDVTNQLVPQDGKMKVRIAGEVYEYRVSTIPTVNGEDAVLRIQKTRSLKAMSLRDIGFEPEDYRLYSDRFSYPSGLIVNAGGTGEGKTTTLYLTLQELLKLFGRQKRILTVEDPVEVYFPEAVQVEVNEKQGRTFASVLRSFLRHDPDIILVGEIRDEETAVIAARAALTGHLVLSTVHAIDSFNAITRLKDLGFSPVVLASVTNVILSQRLVRILCPHCKELRRIPAGLVEKYNLDFEEAYVPVGCENCGGTGYLGRTAVIEVLVLDAELKDAVSQNMPEVGLKKLAREKGFRNLWYNALKKVKAGITSLSEIESKMRPDPILNTTVLPVGGVDLGIVLYPHRKLKVKLDGKTGYLYDVSSKGTSILFDEPIFLEIDRPHKATVFLGNGEAEFVFIPKSYRKMMGGGFIVGGTYKGRSLKKLIGE